MAPAYVGVEPNNSDDDFKVDPSEHGRLRAQLCNRYGLTGEYVGAPTIALILGLGRTTVHDQIRSNRFVIPHRLADRKPLFLIDDLVAWMLGRERPHGCDDEAPPERPARKFSKSAVVFKHADAHEAFLLMCERRGISPHRQRP